MKKKPRTKAEKDYHEWVATKTCVACGSWPVTIHHIRNFDGVNVGMGQRSGAFLSIGLCPDCHQGPAGIHHNRKLFEMRWGTETDLLERQIKRLWADRAWSAEQLKK